MNSRKILGTAVLGAALAACAAGSASAAPVSPVDSLPVGGVAGALDDVKVGNVQPSAVTRDVPVGDNLGSVVGGAEGLTGDNELTEVPNQVLGGAL
ncbi:hypothetical protein [Streptomyces boninensis]|uniref:hypothetical protein n=1 Tax=Streptomyces boninensis TaxID=2039455 RepID=UPI003B211DC1